MTYKIIVTMNLERAKNSLEARKQVLKWLFENKDHPCFSRALNKFSIRGGGMTQLCGKRMVDRIIRARGEINKNTLRKFWEEAGGKGPCLEDRDDRIFGYEDDAVLLTSRRYDYFLNNIERFMRRRGLYLHYCRDCEFGSFVDLDRDILSRRSKVKNGSSLL